jgi:aryl-phospho-beta-D-glucosidase BglC (GH1 family)
VNIGGLFVLERWITPNLVEWGNTTGIIDQYSFSSKCSELGVCDTLRSHWYDWYSQKDFDDMKIFELNTVRLPVGYWYFEEISGYTSAPYLIPKESIFSRMILRLPLASPLLMTPQRIIQSRKSFAMQRTLVCR